MNRELAKKVADAVLYEGYMLYPYRRSAIKNRQRWSFGILYPPNYEEVRSGTERSEMHSECLLMAKPDARVEIQLRFLHLVTNAMARDSNHQAMSTAGADSGAEDWEEGIERSLEFEVAVVGEKQQQFEFNFPSSCEIEPAKGTNGEIIGDLSQTQHGLSGTLRIRCERIADDVLKLSIDVSNSTVLPVDLTDRDSALPHSMLSAHTILSVHAGEFVSLLDPAPDLCEAVKACKNVGNFPVLVGNADERDMLLCSPIVLYDFPQIAPESAGDFYDATEMDEMLTLRVMTLTDQEKQHMRSGDEHIRNLLQRTEQNVREQLMKTHGTIRSLRPVSEP